MSRGPCPCQARRAVVRSPIPAPRPLRAPLRATGRAVGTDLRGRSATVAAVRRQLRHRRVTAGAPRPGSSTACAGPEPQCVGPAFHAPHSSGRRGNPCNAFVRRLPIERDPERVGAAETWSRGSPRDVYALGCGGGANVRSAPHIPRICSSACAPFPARSPLAAPSRPCLPAARWNPIPTRRSGSESHFYARRRTTRRKDFAQLIQLLCLVRHLSRCGGARSDDSVATAAALVLVTVTASSFRPSEWPRSMRCAHYGTNELTPEGARYTAR